MHSPWTRDVKGTVIYGSVILLESKLSGAWQNDVNACIVLPGNHRSARRMGTYFTLSPIYNLYVLFVEISYQARFCLHISYPAILFTRLMGSLNRGIYIINAVLPGKAKRSHCQSLSWMHTFTSFCRAHNNI